MKPNQILLLTAAFIMTCSAHAVELTPTENLTATFTSTIEAGTCAAQIQDSSGTPTSAINFNDVYKSELKQKSKIQPFKLVFSDCSGVKSAEITANPTAGACSGTGASVIHLPTMAALQRRLRLNSGGMHLTAALSSVVSTEPHRKRSHSPLRAQP